LGGVGNEVRRDNKQKWMHETIVCRNQFYRSKQVKVTGRLSIVTLGKVGMKFNFSDGGIFKWTTE
jgi:hypothetical protein